MMRVLQVILILLAFDVFAQGNCEHNKFNASANVDLVSRYIWRGMEFGENTPHFQPYINLNYNFTSTVNFTLGAWGSYGFTGDYSESDLSATLNIATESAGAFSLGLSDYFYPFVGLDFSNYKKEGEGAHTIELAFNYYGTEHFPIHLLFSNNILNTPKDEKSFYAELGYSFRVQDVSLSIFAGGASGVSSWHLINETGFKIINTGVTASKEVKINESISIPVGISWIMNPYLKTTYIVAKITLL
jgi:hypothetical protein